MTQSPKEEGENLTRTDLLLAVLAGNGLTLIIIGAIIFILK
jgi:hypothetical protein